MKKEAHSPILRILFIDLLLLNLIYLGMLAFAKNYSLASNTPVGVRYRFFLVVLNFLWVFIVIAFNRYSFDVSKGIAHEVKNIFFKTLIFTASLSVFAFAYKDLKLSRIIIYGTVSIFFLALVISHLLILIILKNIRAKKLRDKKVLIFGKPHVIKNLVRQLTGSELLVSQCILIVEENGENECREDLSSMSGCIVLQEREADINNIFKSHKISEFFIPLSTASKGRLDEMLEVADYHGVRVRIVPDFPSLSRHTFQVRAISHIPIIDVVEIPLDNYYNARYKRMFDIFFSFFTLVLISPVLLLIGLLVKITSRGPVLYVPDRVGIAGKVFKLYKFRTMYESAGNNNAASTKKNDSRVTGLGRFLRKYNLDELPQFFNVLKGEMSVVGPRPHRVFLDKVMQNSVDQYMLRHYIKPGITGWAQVNGWRGPTLTEEQKIQRTHHDLWYIKNWSFLLDIKIIIKTIFAKKARKNAF